MGFTHTAARSHNPLAMLRGAAPLTAGGRDRLARDAVSLALVFVVYWVAARLSLGIALVHNQVTPIWPPTGIAVVALLVLGRKAVAPIVLASFATNLPLGPSPAAAGVIAIGDTLAPLVSAELLKRAGFHLELDRLRDAVLIIGLGALVGMLVSATVGSTTLMLAGGIRPAGYWVTWTVWWTGDAMGVLLVAPFLLSLRGRPDLPAFTWRSAAELTGLLVATTVAALALFQAPPGLDYLVFPLIMAAAWRFRLRGAAPAALIASLAAILTAVHGGGSFAGLTLLQKMVVLQVFNVSVALASFVLAAFIEARERREEALRLYESARLASEAKSEFLKAAAHELRTPVAVINGYLSLLEERTFGETPDSWSRPLKTMLAKIGELNNIVDELLEAARLERGARDSTRSHEDLRHLALAAVERARARAELIGAQVTLDAASDPVPVAVNADGIGRILDNLINNGLAYSPRPAEVLVQPITDRGRALVRVVDNGIGIPETTRDRIFESFFRGGLGHSSEVAGSGLGLYISRQLAESHGGSLVLERTELGAGSTFTLALPLDHADALLTEQSAVSEPA